MEMLHNSTKAGAHGDKIASDTNGRPVERVSRAHSWDSSQGSGYAYSEEAVTAESTSAEQDQERHCEDIDQAIDLSNHDAQDNNHEDDGLKDGIQLEDAQRETSSENQNLGAIELKDFGGPNETDVQKAQPEIEDQDSPDDQNSVEREHGGSCTPLEPARVLHHKKGKRFGLFGASLGPDTELVVESVYVEPLQRHRDLVQKRRRDREQNEDLEKKARYNLRPRRLGRADRQDSLPTRPSIDSDEEPGRSCRTIRSTTAFKQERKPILRSKAARKTAWSAMGILPIERPHSAKPHRQIVQVVIPVINKLPACK